MRGERAKRTLGGALRVAKKHARLLFSILFGRVDAKKKSGLLMMEFIKILHVPKDDVLLIEDSRGDLLHPARHLPQVSLQEAT